MVTTVKRQFARRLPSDLISLVLEFANFENAERKRAWLKKFKRFASIIPEVFLPESDRNISTAALMTHTGRADPRVPHTFVRETNTARNFRYSLEVPLSSRTGVLRTASLTRMIQTPDRNNLTWLPAGGLDGSPLSNR